MHEDRHYRHVRVFAGEHGNARLQRLHLFRFATRSLRKDDQNLTPFERVVAALQRVRLDTVSVALTLGPLAHNWNDTDQILREPAHQTIFQKIVGSSNRAHYRDHAQRKNRQHGGCIEMAIVIWRHDGRPFQGQTIAMPDVHPQHDQTDWPGHAHSKQAAQPGAQKVVDGGHGAQPRNARRLLHGRARMSISNTGSRQNGKTPAP